MDLFFIDSGEDSAYVVAKNSWWALWLWRELVAHDRDAVPTRMPKCLTSSGCALVVGKDVPETAADLPTDPDGPGAA